MFDNLRLRAPLSWKWHNHHLISITKYHVIAYFVIKTIGFSLNYLYNIASKRKDCFRNHASKTWSLDVLEWQKAKNVLHRTLNSRINHRQKNFYTLTWRVTTKASFSAFWHLFDCSKASYFKFSACVIVCSSSSHKSSIIQLSSWTKQVHELVKLFIIASDLAYHNIPGGSWCI